MSGSHISLFAGVGMTDIAAEAFGFKTVATAEIDPWCQKVLARRFPDAKHYRDVRHVRRLGNVLAGVDNGDFPKFQRPLLVSGGFPCQDVSSAGTGLGLDGARSGLWAEFARVIREFDPEYVLIENSPMLRHRGLDRIIYDLTTMLYHVRWDCIPAAAVGAPHLRDRIFIVAYKWDGKPDEWLNLAGESIPSDERDRLPRAGVAAGQLVWQTEPTAPIRAAKQACLAHPVACPATPTGAWPTPAASNPQDGESAQSWLARRETLKAKGINGNGAGMPLNIAVKLYPTPTRSDGAGGPGTTPKRTGGKNLRTVVAESDGNGRLNPEWVEWMMGLPIGWTEPTMENVYIKPHPGWHEEPQYVSRTVPDRHIKDRSKRIRALGNGLVPQAAAVALSWLPTL